MTWKALYLVKKLYLNCHCDQSNVTVWRLLVCVEFFCWIGQAYLDNKKMICYLFTLAKLKSVYPLMTTHLVVSCSSTTKLLGGDWFSVLIPWLTWLLFMWLMLLLLCWPVFSMLLWITFPGVVLWFSFDMWFNESLFVVDVGTAVMFRSVNRLSTYAEYAGVLKISHPMFFLQQKKNRAFISTENVTWKLCNCEKYEAI